MESVLYLAPLYMLRARSGCWAAAATWGIPAGYPLQALPETERVLSIASRAKTPRNFRRNSIGSFQFSNKQHHNQRHHARHRRHSQGPTFNVILIIANVHTLLCHSEERRAVAEVVSAEVEVRPKKKIKLTRERQRTCIFCA